MKTTHITIKGVLKSSKVPEKVKDMIRKHPILGNPANQTEIYFKLLKFGSHQGFFIKCQKTGDMIPFLNPDDSIFNDMSSGKKKKYKYICSYCEKKNNDTKQYKFQYGYWVVFWKKDPKMKPIKGHMCDDCNDKWFRETGNWC